MRNFKKFLTLALAVVMVASMFAFGASAANFTDVDENNEYLNKAVNLLTYVGVAKGTSDTEFGTEELVTREQMAAFIYRLMKKGDSVEGGTNSSSFTDLEDPTFFFMVSWANSQGIIKGTSATTFEPKGSITLQDAYTMIVRALGYEKEETLPYPFGYIEIAEKKGVELAEGLSSEVSYTDALTRGDVAILLYNAFFAETGVAETKQVEKEIGEGENATWVLQTVTEYPILCEKIFDVLEVEYQAIATPNYTFGEDETTKDLGYDAVLFDYVGDERTDAPAQFYADAADLAIDGKADDYIMSHFTMYVTLDDDNAVEDILYAEPLMTKKTVSEIKLESVTTNTANSYYKYVDADGEEQDGAKRLSGKVVIDGKEAYFYNAPYSYAKPTYTTGISEAYKYFLRNEENMQFIGKQTLGDVEDNEYEYGLYAFNRDFINVEEDEGGNLVFVTPDEAHKKESETLIKELAQVYTDGLYEATVYDVDGDGLYDYIEYLPYVFAFVDTDEDMDFSVDTVEEVDGKPVVYTNGAVVEGEKFADGDMVIAYLDPAANYIKVVAVVDPIKGSLKNIKTSTGMITLSNDEKASAKDAWKLVANYDAKFDEVGYDKDEVKWELSDVLNTNNYDNEDLKCYIYNGAVLFTENADNNVTFSDNLIIITTDDNDDTFQTEFNAELGKKILYAYAWVDGELKYVPIDTESDIFPAFDEANRDSYIGKVATYSVDSNGVYTVSLLGEAEEEGDVEGEYDYIGIPHGEDMSGVEDEDGNEMTYTELLAADEEDDKLQVFYKLDSAELTRKFSKRFALTDIDFQLLLNDNTVVVIKNTEKATGDVEYLEYSADTLTSSIVGTLTNVQLVVENNIGRAGDTRENLVLLYAEGEDLELDKASTSSKSERIVKDYNVVPTDNDEWAVEYTLYNPYTGKTETAFGTERASKAGSLTKIGVGYVAEMTTTGELDEDKVSTGAVYVPDNTYWIKEYNAAEETMIIAPYADPEAELNIKVDSSLVITKMGGTGNGAGDSGIVQWGSMSVVDAADVENDSKSLKGINDRYQKPGSEKYTTVYAEYIKAYVDFDEADSSEAKEGYDGVANFVTIIINKGEKIDNCEI